MKTHSPEPWQIAGQDDYIIDLHGYGVPMMFENRRRIVACVNACKGSSTDWLMGYGSTIDGIAGALPMQENIAQLVKQRDELLIALKRCASVLAGEELSKGTLVHALESARNAIKKCELPK